MARQTESVPRTSLTALLGLLFPNSGKSPSTEIGPVGDVKESVTDSRSCVCVRFAPELSARRTVSWRIFTVAVAGDPI